jgi:hypothetical protein
VVCLSPNSLDLTPCDFFPIPEDKIEAQGVTFDSNEGIQTGPQDAMNTLM